MASQAQDPPGWIDMDEAQNYTPRHEASFVQAGDKFYLFGGRENARRIDVYDFNTNSWSWNRDALAPVEFNHFQATEYEGLIWVVGAFRTNSFPNETPAGSVYVYDPANSSWMRGPDIPNDRRRGSTGLVVYEDKFYVVGGNTIGHNGGFVNWFDEYDPQTGTWTALSDAPHDRDHFHATVADDKLYSIGGRLSGGSGGTFAPLIAEVDVYDFATNRWETLPPESNLPTPRAAAAVANFDGRIMVIGGEGNGRAYDTVEALDPSTNSWETLASLHHRRHGTQAIVSGEGVYVAVGSPKQGGGNQRNMEVYNANIPAGVASIAGGLNGPEETQVAAGSQASIILDHSGGNQGVFITEVRLTGPNASDFSINGPVLDPFLVRAGGRRELFVEFGGTTDGVTASLEVHHSGKETLSIPLIGKLRRTMDLSDDGTIDHADADLLVSEIVRQGELGFDLNADGVIDANDLGTFLTNAAAENGLAAPYQRGDVDLDGSVGSADLNALAVHWQQIGTLWSGGDFDANNVTDTRDLNALALNWQRSIRPAHAHSVPEPTMFWMAFLFLPGVANYVRSSTARY